MSTHISHLSKVATTVGAPPGWIKEDLLAGRHEARLSKPTDLTHFGVNHVTLAPGSISALRHWHEGEDEFIYILSGELTLVDNAGASELIEGSFAAFPAGVANGHHLVNHSRSAGTFLVVGSRRDDADICHYPDDDFGPITR